MKKILRLALYGVILLSFSYLFRLQRTTPEKRFEKTLPGLFEIKAIKPSTILATYSHGPYFEKADRLFSRLFKYLKRHHMQMTTPVEADIEPAGMRFYVGNEDVQKPLPNEKEVSVENVPEKVVASYGEKGNYSPERILGAQHKLEEWLQHNDRYHPTGKPYAVFWDSPFKPGFLKRFEIHIPVTT